MPIKTESHVKISSIRIIQKGIAPIHQVVAVLTRINLNAIQAVAAGLLVKVVDADKWDSGTKRGSVSAKDPE